MIIGNNNNFNDNNFQRKLDSIKENANNHKHNDNPHIKQYKDINNSDEMLNESISILQDRLNKGLISYEDFMKQCDKLNKLRK